MGLLIDKELRDGAHSSKNNYVKGIPDTKLVNDIRGCAVDLHIGEIFLPGKKDTDSGAASAPKVLPVSLAQGQTAVIRTAESFKLDAQHAAFVFPATSVSILGLLMTNPGLVDPGYEGEVHVTVINMGREPFPLQPGGRLLRALIYKLDQNVESPKVGGNRPITDELLNKLSADFLDVTERTEKAAKREIEAALKHSSKMQYVYPALFTLIGVIGSAVLTYFSNTARFDSRIQELERANSLERVQKLEVLYPTEKRMFDLETQNKQLKEEVDRLKTLRDAAKAKAARVPKSTRE